MAWSWCLAAGEGCGWRSGCVPGSWPKRRWPAAARLLGGSGAWAARQGAG
jgi:hypothetical protein